MAKIPSEQCLQPLELNKHDFGSGFQWGVSSAAYQIEGNYRADGKGLSIWDVFSERKGKIYKGQNGKTACDFYRRYEEDLALMSAMNIPNFRFSISWSRLISEGNGPVNPKGKDFYDRLIDRCLHHGIEPWVTLYHWDLPYALERKGGWTNRDIVNWFAEYSEVCARSYGDRVSRWMVLNEPLVFTGAGYFLGVHAPGRTGLKNFLPAMHHATLCQAEGGRILKHYCPGAEVGSTFSCSYIEPYRDTEKDRQASMRVDALLNRLFLEPALGLGYPVNDLKALKRVEHYCLPGDEEKMKFDFDFIGVQNYTREIVRHSWFNPLLAKIVEPEKRKVPVTLMNWEIYPPAIYEMLRKYDSYPNIKKIYITENGAAFPDRMEDGKVNDQLRIDYLKQYLHAVLKAKKEGMKVDGYFVWTFIDNFEWAKGYFPRFGLVHVDFDTQRRLVKSSGEWYSEFLRG